MKLITALIPKDRLESAKHELGKVRVFRLTITEAQGIGPMMTTAAESNSEVRSEPMLKLLVAVNEEFLQPTLGALQRAVVVDGEPKLAGRIFVQRLEEVIRIRTGERGPAGI